MMFGGPRMFAWLATGMQLAGFEMWDTMTFFWVHAQGFPKAQDMGKQVAKLTGEEPIDEVPNSAANAWRGYKTPALKPAYEPILCFRAPRYGMTYAKLAITYGTGCLNVDGGRIPTKNLSVGGRYPANLILDEKTADMLDEQSGNTVSSRQEQPRGTGGMWSGVSNTPCGAQYSDSGGASRFFYCAKASREERNAGCEDLPVIEMGMSGGAQSHGEGYDRGQDIGFNRVISRYNDHPCVKPLELCRHLATLLLPPQSVAPRRLLVPFAGSGSEMIGAMQAGWDEIVGIEQDAHYCEIAERRIQYWRGIGNN